MDKFDYGFKGTDRNMKCKGFQYEMHRIYRKKRIEICGKGFHLCKRLINVLSYYPLMISDGDGFDNEEFYYQSNYRYFLVHYNKNNYVKKVEGSDEKRVSNTISFVEEIRCDENYLKYLLKQSPHKDIYKKNIDGLKLICENSKNILDKY